MQVKIHPQAIIGKGAQIDEGVTIEKGALIGPNATIHRDTIVESGAIIDGKTTIGTNNLIYPGTKLGLPPQGPNYLSGQLIIGHNNIFLDNVSVHAGSLPEKSTIIGDHNLIYTNTHIGHDCQIGNHNQLIEVVLAGNVHIHNGTVIGGGTHVHQYCTFGDLSFIAGMTAVRKDVPPYAAIADYQRAPKTFWGKLALIYEILFNKYSPEVKIRFLNKVGLQRAGFSQQQMDNVENAYSFLFETLSNLENRALLLKEKYQNPEAENIANFVLKSKRGIYIPQGKLRFVNPSKLFKNRHEYDSAKEKLEEKLK